VVIAVLVLLFAMTDTGAPTSAKRKAEQIACMNNLKQIRLACLIWAGDNHDKYPMEISVTNGGTLELIGGSDAWKTFLVMSNELGTPRLLCCCGDSLRTNAYGFGPGFSATNISYFISPDASANITNGKALLVGDDNLLADNSPAKPGLLALTAGTSVAWDSSRHKSVKTHSWFSKTKPNLGNIALEDGNVRSTDDSTLADYLTQTGLATNRLFIP
jgi:hypothetical protein